MTARVRVCGGKPVSVFQAASDLGGVIGPLLAGALADAASPTAAFASAFVLLAASALVPPSAASAVLAGALLLLLESFGRDVVWLHRHRTG